MKKVPFFIYPQCFRHQTDCMQVYCTSPSQYRSRLSLRLLINRHCLDHHLSTVESNSNHRRTPETTIDDLWRIRAKYDKTVDLDLCVIDDKSVLFCCCPTHSTVNSPRVLKCRCERAPLVREELQRGTVRVYRRYGNITIDGSTWAFGRRSLRAENWVVILTKTTPTSLLVGVLARLTAGREQRDNKNVNCSTCNWEKTRELVR